MDYKIHLDTFSGPLDLLLFLVKRHEVDLRDIPIAVIARQFQEYVAVLQHIDLEEVGDFLVMAATLTEIKSKLMLPRDEPAEAPDPTDDPRRELVRQLIEYRKYKDAAQALESRAEQQATRFARQAPVEAAEPGVVPVRPVEVWDLVSAFGRLMRETLALQPRSIVADETPQHVYMDVIRQRLQTEERLSFRAVFTPPHRRSRLVGLFLAILELIKGREVLAEQTEPFGDIWLRRTERDA